VTCVCAVVTSQARSGNRFYNKKASGKNKRAGSGKPYTKFNGSRFKQTGTDNSLLLVRLLVLGNEVVHVGRSLVSPVHPWRKPMRRSRLVNCSPTVLDISWMAVELLRKLTDILWPLGDATVGGPDV
jgi:hypothetical protein